MYVVKSRKPMRILDFDIEQRPLSWIGGDYVSKEVTAIGAQFVGEDEQYCWLLGVDEPEEMLEGFLALYDEADMVTGHNIRGYDLPALNAALVDYNMPMLRSKLSHDTYHDLRKLSGISKSQESLAATLGLMEPKIQMNQLAWREANRLTSEGIELTRERVLGDVIQHIALRAQLLELGYLQSPKRWNP